MVTGTPGAGKTSIAKRLAKTLGLVYIDVNALIKKCSELIDSKDRDGTLVIDEDKLETMLGAREGVIDSHLSHYAPKRIGDVCIVVRCAPRVLKKRLEARGYSKQKIADNLESEIMNVCGADAFDRGHRILEVDTTTRLLRKTVALLKEHISHVDTSKHIKL